MDRTGIIVVSLCAILFVVWVCRAEEVAQHQSQYAATHHGVTPTAPATAAARPILQARRQLGKSVQRPDRRGCLDTNAPEKLIAFTNADAIYTFTSRGGGLQSVKLTKYPDSISLRWKKEVATNGVATLNAHAPVPVLAILGDPGLVGDGNFTLTRTADGVRAEKVLPDGLRLVKEFHISSNYLVNAEVRLVNTSDQPVALPAQQWVIGTATPMGPDDNGLYLGAMWYNGTNSPQDCTVVLFQQEHDGVLLSFRGRPKRFLKRVRATSSGRRCTTSFSR